MVSRFGNKQSGAVLILIAFILGLGVTAYLIKTMNATTLAQQQDEKTYKALAEAKAALIAWAVSHPNLPGLMPYPDRNSDGNYDDTSDCYATNVNFATNFVLGRLPLYKNDPNCVSGAIATVPNGLGGDFRDGSGERLWYEVSRNLLYDYKAPGTAPIINPSIANNPNYAWMTVRDRNGVLISNRVAAVIIAPGSPLGTQDRSGGIADANQYLDKVVMADGTPYQNYGYPDPATNPVQEFIIGDDYRTVAKNDPSYKNQSIEPYYFNDKLVYITIDELMDALQKRVGEQVKTSLKAYYIESDANPANRYYPYAANFDAASGKKYCVNNQLAGALPLDIAPTTPYSCDYKRTSTTASNISCGFDKVGAIAFTRATSSFTVSATVGQCVVSSSVTTSSDRRVCTCTGAGSCSNALQKFECLADGTCTTTGVSGGGTYAMRGGIFSSAPAPCSFSCTSGKTLAVSCGSGTTVGNATFTYTPCTDNPFNTSTSTLPTWFQTNGWQDYVYYQMTRPADINGLVTGGKKAAAIVVTVSSAITTAPYTSKASSQSQPSCNLNDYMDSTENTNGDNVFEATNKIKSQNYNDQIFLVN